MAIEEFKPNQMTESEINKYVDSALASYGRTPRDFEHASLHYNSTFFRDLPEEFKRRLCTALNGAFAPNVNAFWQKNSEGV